MAQAFLAVGADAYLGWSKSVEDREAGESARFWVDAILGAPSLFELFDTSEEPTEPSLCTQAVTRMETTFRRGGSRRVSQSINGCVLRASGRGSSVGTLLPKIENVSLNGQNDSTVLSGRFGSTQGSVVALPSSTSIPVRHWSATSITTGFVPGATEFRVDVHGVRGNTFSIGLKNYALEGTSGVPSKSAKQ